LPSGEERQIEMSSDELERRINNRLETIIETQANLQEAIAGLIQVARLHDEQLDQIRQQTADNSRQIKENSEQIAALREQGKEQDERINALIRIVEGHVTNHP
jgi:hypothetical protein